MQQIAWTIYFERELYLSRGRGDGAGDHPEQVTHHAYLISPVGKSGPLFVMHHGAGSSGLSFAVVSAEIRNRMPNAGILSIDARGHGSTTVTKPGHEDEPEGPADLSLGTLATDLGAIIDLTRVEMCWSELPSMVLVGHSLGGAVVTELAQRRTLGEKLLGYAVLDVVEGSAMDALASMHTYLTTRPLGFPSPEAAIEWHVRSRTVRNSTSARASVPSLLVRQAGSQNHDAQRRDDKVFEAPATEDTGSDDDPRPWKWRTNLAATQPFWENWFVGLSKKFLSAPGGKLLLLAGTDRLDTELTIGQMQGMCPMLCSPRPRTYLHACAQMPRTSTLVI